MRVLRAAGAGVKWAGVGLHLTANALLFVGFVLALAWGLLYWLGVLGPPP